jgi:hypothetical protein
MSSGVWFGVLLSIPIGIGTAWITPWLQRKFDKYSKHRAMRDRRYRGRLRLRNAGNLDGCGGIGSDGLGGRALTSFTKTSKTSASSSSVISRGHFDGNAATPRQRQTRPDIQAVAGPRFDIARVTAAIQTHWSGPINDPTGKIWLLHEPGPQASVLLL